VKRQIRLKGVSGDIEGKTWESTTRLRAGRLSNLDIVLDDNSVSRLHAEVRATVQGWAVRDLKSTNGTFLNGVRLEPDEERAVQERDIIQCGKVAMVVESLGEQATPAPEKVPMENLLIEAATSS
jgi:pSer/pThr/pTyr-binding forkhead associated (FHA) protein